MDLTTPDGPARLVEEATRTFGGLDILVNNVGAVRPRLEGFLALTDDDWDWALTINFLAAVRTTRAALPHLLDRAPATIVTVSSVNAFLPDPAVIDYSAAKGAWGHVGIGTERMRGVALLHCTLCASISFRIMLGLSLRALW